MYLHRLFSHYLWVGLGLLCLTMIQRTALARQEQPSPTSSQSTDNEANIIIPLIEHLELKKVRFSDKVTSQKLSLAVMPKILPQTSSGSDDKTDSNTTVTPPQRAFVLRFVTQGIAKGRQLLMPQTGNFKLHIVPGTSFQVLDADARDGDATVQMPPGLRDVYLRTLNSQTARLQSKTASLILKEPLYYVTQELVSTTEPLPTTTLPAQPLNLQTLCSEDPETFHLWQIDNPNAYPVTYAWYINAIQFGLGVAPPGHSYLETGKESNPHTLEIDTL